MTHFEDDLGRMARFADAYVEAVLNEQHSAAIHRAVFAAIFKQEIDEDGEWVSPRPFLYSDVSQTATWDANSMAHEHEIQAGYMREYRESHGATLGYRPYHPFLDLSYEGPYRPIDYRV